MKIEGKHLIDVDCQMSSPLVLYLRWEAHLAELVESGQIRVLPHGEIEVLSMDCDLQIEEFFG